MVRVSVIVPCYEDRGWLDEAIKSIEAQSYRNIEVVVVKKKRPVGHNLNFGIKKSTGDLICYLCDDDLLPPWSIMRRVAAMGENDFIHGCSETFGDKQVPYVPRLREPTLDDMLDRNVIHGGTVMYRRDVFERFGWFDKHLMAGEEYEFNMRILAGGGRLGYCDDVVYMYRRHAGQKGYPRDVAMKLWRLQQIDNIRDKYR